MAFIRVKMAFIRVKMAFIRVKMALIRVGMALISVGMACTPTHAAGEGRILTPASVSQTSVEQEASSRAAWLPVLGPF